MRKVITYGTFDLFHKGHYNILKRAKELGDYLIVGVTGESYDIERGKLSVRDSLVERIENVRKTGFADEIIVEEYLGQKIQDIIKYNIDVLVVGSDWKGKFDHLRKYCEVVYLERTKDISSTLLRETKVHICKMGIVTNDNNDNDMVKESKYVSGIHVESVFSENNRVALSFADKYELSDSYTDYEEFLESADIIYIKMPREKCYEYIKNALIRGKHVISDTLATIGVRKVEELFNLAEEHKVILVGNMPIFYLQSFNQLLWNARGNLIGDILNIKCSIGKSFLYSNAEADTYDAIEVAISVIGKLIGYNLDVNSYANIVNDSGLRYMVLTGQEKNASSSFFVEIGLDMNLDSSMLILGTKGKISIPGDWWTTGYFKMDIEGEEREKRFSSNFGGNGVRYLLQSLLGRIELEKVQTVRILPKEIVSTASIIEKLNKKYSKLAV